MLGVRCISPSVHIVSGQTKPFTGLLLGGAVSLPGLRLVVCLLPPGAGVTLIGEGLLCFLTPGGLPLPRSDYGSAYWLRVGQAGVNMCEASGKPPSAWEEGPALPRRQGVAHPGDVREAGCMAGAGASRPPFGVLWSQLPIRDEDTEVRRLSE